MLEIRWGKKGELRSSMMGFGFAICNLMVFGFAICRVSSGVGTPCPVPVGEHAPNPTMSSHGSRREPPRPTFADSPMIPTRYSPTFPRPVIACLVCLSMGEDASFLHLARHPSIRCCRATLASSRPPKCPATQGHCFPNSASFFVSALREMQ